MIAWSDPKVKGERAKVKGIERLAGLLRISVPALTFQKDNVSPLA